MEEGILSRLTLISLLPVLEYSSEISLDNIFSPKLLKVAYHGSNYTSKVIK